MAPYQLPVRTAASRDPLHYKRLTTRTSDTRQFSLPIPPHARSSSSSSSSRCSFAPWRRRFAQLLLCIAASSFVLSQVVAFTPLYALYVEPAIAQWWHNDHPEMIGPTYFTLCSTLPLLVALVSASYLQQPHRLSRVGSSRLLSLAALLRKRPYPRIFRHLNGSELVVLCIIISSNVCVMYFIGIQRLQHQTAIANLTLDFVLITGAITFGFNCLLNLAFLLLPATRNASLFEFFDIPYPHTVTFHRWLGVWTVITAVLHCAGFYIKWILNKTWQRQSLPCFDCPLDSIRGMRVWRNVFGELALLAFVLIGLTSVPWLRRQCFWLFTIAHQLLFVVSIVCIVLHWAPSVWWLLPTLVVYCTQRTLASVHNALATPVALVAVESYGNSIVKLVVQTKSSYAIGQFVYLNAPAISKLQWHPFTIASSSLLNDSTLTLVVKATGAWTRAFVHLCAPKQEPLVVFVDGVYGTSPLALYAKYKTLYLIGGGIGVTPLLAVLEDVVAREPVAQQRIVLIWTFRDVAVLEAMQSLVQQLKDVDPYGDWITIHLFWTQHPSQNDLQALLVHKQGDATAHQPLHKQRTRAFHVPLTSHSWLQPLAIVVAVATATIALGMRAFQSIDDDVEENKTNNNATLWPLQLLATASVLLCTAAGVVSVFVGLERLWLWTRQATNNADDSNEDLHAPLLFADVEDRTHATQLPLGTIDALVHAYNVTIGVRPDVLALLQRALDAHTEGGGESPIGVFVSGPEGLKRATFEAVDALGARAFDVYDEAFEL